MATFGQMARSLLRRWEALAPRHQVLLGIVVGFPLLLLVHAAFPLLSWQERLGYAAFEAVPLALLVTFATQTELRRRELRDADPSEDLSIDPAWRPDDEA